MVGLAAIPKVEVGSYAGHFTGVCSSYNFLIHGRFNLTTGATHSWIPPPYIRIVERALPFRGQEPKGRRRTKKNGNEKMFPLISEAARSVISHI